MRNIFKMIVPYFRQYKYRVLIYILLCIVASGCTLVVPYITGGFIDDLLVCKTYDVLVKYCNMLLVFFIVSTILNIICNILYTQLQMQMGYQFNKKVILHVQNIERRWLENIGAAYLSQQINNDTNELIIFSLNIFQNIITNSFMFILPVFILVKIKREIAIIVAVAIILYAASYKATKKIVYQNNEKYKETQSVFFSRINEQVRYANFIKLHSAFNWFSRRLDEAFERMMNVSLVRQKANLRISSINGLILTFMRMMIYFFSGKAIIDGEISIGSFTIISTYFSKMSLSVNFFSGLGKSIQENQVAYRRIKKLLDIPQESTGCIRPKQIDRIQINNLKFTYDNNLIFNGENFTFEKGFLYLISGSNGSGKSTLINLIMGILDFSPESKIQANQYDYRELDMKYVREKLFAISEQSSVLVADSFLNNVMLGCKDVNYEKLDFLVNEFDLSALLQYEAEDEKYKIRINEEVSNLSGGEKQKIAIIRTILKNSEVMIFDEPTSALDRKSRQNFYKIIQVLKKEKIIILISHDQYAYAIADVNIVLKPKSDV